MDNIRTKQWGMAWVALSVGLGLHVADEAITDFSPLYNAIVGSIREANLRIPLPTFTVSVWLTGLVFGVLILFLLSPMVFAGQPDFGSISYLLGAFMTLNALAHVGASMYLGVLAPGALSSPILLFAALMLIVTTRRVRHLASA